MDVDDDGPAAGEPNRGLVEEPGDRAPVEARPVHQLRLREVRRIEAAGLALGPAHRPAAHEVERIRLLSRASGGKREGEPCAGAAPGDVPDPRSRTPHKRTRGTDSST